MTKSNKSNKMKTVPKMSAYQKIHPTTPCTSTTSALTSSPFTPTISANTKNRITAAKIKLAKHAMPPLNSKGYDSNLRLSADPNCTFSQGKSEQNIELVDIELRPSDGGISESESESSIESIDITEYATGGGFTNVDHSMDRKREFQNSSEKSSDDESDSSSEAQSDEEEESDSDEEKLLTKHENKTFNSFELHHRNSEAGEYTKVVDSDCSEDADDYSSSEEEDSTSEISFRSSTAEDIPDGNTEMIDDSDSSSVEETIISLGARSALADLDREILGNSSVGNSDVDDMVEDDGMVAQDESASDSDHEVDSIEGYSRAALAYSTATSEYSESSATLSGFAAAVEAPEASQIPEWFPENIKKIFETDHHGGALAFTELNRVTHYRALLEITRRRKWKKYIEAGQARWKLQKILHKQRVRPTTKRFYAFRKEQYDYWKDEALCRWKKLEKFQKAVLVLDEMINTNFLMERVIYRKKLD